MTESKPKHNLIPSWSEQKSKLILSFPQLTDDDFYYDLGKKDVMLNKLASRINKTRDELEAIMKSFR